MRKPCRRCGGEKPSGPRRHLCDECSPLTPKEITAQYRKRNPNKIREQTKRYAEQNPEKLREIALRSHHKNPKRKLLNLARSRARKNNMDFNIVSEDIEIPSICPVLGIEIIVGGGTGFSDSSPTIDRIDNSKGYIKDNVKVISWRANRIKCDATIQELRAIVNYMSSNA